MRLRRGKSADCPKSVGQMANLPCFGTFVACLKAVSMNLS